MVPLVPKDINKLQSTKLPRLQWSNKKTVDAVHKNQLSIIHQPMDESARQSPEKPFEPCVNSHTTTNPFDFVENEQAFLPEISKGGGYKTVVPRQRRIRPLP